MSLDAYSTHYPAYLQSCTDPQNITPPHSVTLSNSTAVMILVNFFICIDGPSNWQIFFSFWTFSLPITSSTLPQPLYRSRIKPYICQYWNPCIDFLHDFISKLPALTISSTNFYFLFLLVSQCQQSYELTRTNKVSILLLFHYLIAVATISNDSCLHFLCYSAWIL